MNVKRAIGGFLLSLVFLGFFAYVTFSVQTVVGSYLQGKEKKEFLGSISDSAKAITPSVPANIISPVSGGYSIPELDAKAAISVESNLAGVNNVIFQKDIDMKTPIASLTKLMTAAVALDNYNLSDDITVDDVAGSQSPEKQDIKAGDTISVENLLEIMLISSSNKSAYALSEGPGGKMGEAAFVNLMNEKAQEIGMENTFFQDPTGLSSQNVSTAGDLAKLAEYLLKNYPTISNISKSKELYVQGFGTVENTDELLGEVPDVVCSKTGFTTEADGCLLLVTTNPKNGNYLINIILGADDRFFEMQKLINWTSPMCNPA